MTCKQASFESKAFRVAHSSTSVRSNGKPVFVQFWFLPATLGNVPETVTSALNHFRQTKRICWMKHIVSENSPHMEKFYPAVVALWLKYCKLKKKKINLNWRISGRFYHCFIFRPDLVPLRCQIQMLESAKTSRQNGILVRFVSLQTSTIRQIKFEVQFAHLFLLTGKELRT